MVRWLVYRWMDLWMGGWMATSYPFSFHFCEKTPVVAAHMPIKLSKLFCREGEYWEQLIIYQLKLIHGADFKDKTSRLFRYYIFKKGLRQIISSSNFHSARSRKRSSPSIVIATDLLIR